MRGKNVRDLGGIPLLAWSIIAARECGLPAFVSTESPDYADVARAWGARVVVRPQELAEDGVGDREVIAHFLSEHPCDLVVYLRPTTPFRTQRVVEGAIDTVNHAQNAATGLRSVHAMGESVYKCFTLLPGPYLDPIRFLGRDLTDRPNQECPKTYKPNGYVDICKREVIEAGGLWGDSVIGFVTPEVCEIDTEEDWAYAEYICQRERRFEIGKTSN